MNKEILFLNPVFTHNIWGGTKLREEYGYDVEGDDIGECWGVAAHENGNCTVKRRVCRSYACRLMGQPQRAVWRHRWCQIPTAYKDNRCKR